MKKFKVIEPSRLLTAQEKRNILGGQYDREESCTNVNTFRNCVDSQAYKTCGIGVTGYNVSNCPEGGGTSMWVTCVEVTYVSTCVGSYPNVFCKGRYGGLN